MREAVIVSAVRTPLGSFNGTLGKYRRNYPRRHGYRGSRKAGGN